MIAASVAVCCPAYSQNQTLATESWQQGSEMTNDQKITQPVQVFGLNSVQAVSAEESALALCKCCSLVPEDIGHTRYL